MKSVHLLIPDLFLPPDLAREACRDLRLPALEKLLARGSGVVLEAEALESYLCGLFTLPGLPDAPIAPISAAFDGLAAGCWLRADPVHLRLQREKMLLLPHLDISAEEATQICASLNEYFAGQGMQFFAPHPLRWYLRLDQLPDIATVPMSLALGNNVQGLLPKGSDALRWHQVFNEIQMLLYAHPLNALREDQGKLPINSVWLWGAGVTLAEIPNSYADVASDDVHAEMLADAVGIPFSPWPSQWTAVDGAQLLLWNGLRSALQGGDLAEWRSALQDFETNYAQPLWAALRSGKIAQLQLDILSAHHIRRTLLTRSASWRWWRRSRHLASYSDY